MFIVWKMPATAKTTKWDIQVVYRDLVFLRAPEYEASSLIDMTTGEGMIVKHARHQKYLLTKFRVSDSLNDLLFDRLDGIDALGVCG